MPLPKGLALRRAIWRTSMKAAGYSEEYIRQLEEAVDEGSRVHDEAVRAMRCPKCNSKLVERVDSRDGGSQFYCEMYGHKHFLVAYEPEALERARGKP